MKKILQSALILGALFVLPQAVSAQEKPKEEVKKEVTKKAAKDNVVPLRNQKPVVDKPINKTKPAKKNDGQMQAVPDKKKPAPMVGRRVQPKPGTKVNKATKIDKKKKMEAVKKD